MGCATPTRCAYLTPDDEVTKSRRQCESCGRIECFDGPDQEEDRPSRVVGDEITEACERMIQRMGA
jgi:hypothetical protein